MSLIKKIYQAVQSGILAQPFTTEEMKLWLNSNSVVKPDGNPYEKASIEAILLNSDASNALTTNKNQKILFSRVNLSGKKEYWF